MNRKYLLPTVIFILGTSLLIVTLIWAQLSGKENHLPFVYGVIPSLPGMVILFSIFSGFGQADERLKRILSHSVLLGFLISMCTLFGLGLMQVYAGWPLMNAALFSAIMSVGFAIGYLVSHRKFT